MPACGSYSGDERFFVVQYYCMIDARQQFIEKHRAKFWYTPEASKLDIGDDLLVETTLNYGSLEDFRELRDILTPTDDAVKSKLTELSLQDL